MRRPEAGFESDKLISGPMPLYYQIANIIRNGILEGNWQPDSQLPTENGLSQKYGVSRPTIRNAKNLLAKEGFVRSIKGSGCYVNNQKAWKNPPPTVDNLNDIFHHGSKMSFKIHECGIISSTEEINHKLKTSHDQFVFQIKGVRWYRGQPISCVRYYLPYRFGSRIPLESLDENPFIPQLEKMAGIKVVEGVQNISLGRADNEVAKHLGLQEGDAVLNVKSVYFDDNQQPVEYLITNYREALPYSIRVKRY
ncbi:MAG: GntR family transcriptional regulator [bacterium]|nr:GntR family transcriptional regulator [bacterium]